MDSIMTNFALKLAKSYNYGYIIRQKIHIIYHYIVHHLNKCNGTKKYRDDFRQGAFT